MRMSTSGLRVLK